MLRFEPDLPERIVAGLGYATAADALLDPRGRTIRCTPSRWTVAGPVVEGRILYRKFRTDRAGGLREWRRLHELGDLGLPVPEPICLALAPAGGVAAGRGSVVVVGAVPGRPLDVLLGAAEQQGRGAAAAVYLSERVAPLVRRLHDLGLCHRDLYCGHLYAEALEPECPPWLIDVERVFRPRPWRRRRWQVKDLAALHASLPPGVSAASQLRFLRAYGGGLDRGWRRLVRAVLAKSARIRGHRPKYG